MPCDGVHSTHSLCLCFSDWMVWVSDMVSTHKICCFFKICLDFLHIWILHNNSNHGLARRKVFCFTSCQNTFTCGCILNTNHALYVALLLSILTIVLQMLRLVQFLFYFFKIRAVLLSYFLAVKQSSSWFSK